MGKTIVLIYNLLFFFGVWSIIITRLVLIMKLYAVKGGKIFDKSEIGEVLGFLASITLPFKVNGNSNDTEVIRIVRKLNRLKSLYWCLMLSLVIYIITMNILEHVYNIRF